MSELLYALDIKDVVKSSFGSLIGLPPFSEINYVTQIERDHPVVVEVLVNDFTHRAFSPIEDIGHKEEQNKQHRALIGQSKSSIPSLRIGWHLSIDVIVFDCQNHRLNHLFYDKLSSTLEREAGKKVFRIILRPSVALLPVFMHSKITIANELNDLVYVANILSSFVAIVGEDDSFPYWPLYQVIHKQKHDSEEVEGLADQLLTLFDGKESFK